VAKRMRAIYNSWLIVLMSFSAVALWYVLSVAPPASYWFEAQTMAIPDAVVGEPIPIVVEREISRPIGGEWTVTIRKLQDGGWIQYCPAIEGRQDYNVNAIFPEPLLLEWWTNGECESLSPGTYIVTTIWTFYPPLIPNGRRTPPLVSNPFRVLESRE